MDKQEPVKTTEPKVEPAVSAITAAPAIIAAAAPIKSDHNDALELIKAERQRVAGLRNLFGGEHSDLEAAAIADGSTVEAASVKLLDAIRKERPAAPNVRVVAQDAINENVIQAAICRTGMMSDYEKDFDEKTLEASQKKFRSGIGLQQILLEAAWANGYTERSFDKSPSGLRDILVHAMGSPQIKAAFSTLSLPTILGNTANKFILRAFNAVESGWRAVAKVSTVNDFKQITRAALDGDFVFKKLGADGEIKHGTTTETTYNNQADTFARMYSITRKDIINDDLGTLTDVPSKIGRGGAIALNQTFWTDTFVANLSTFFTAGRLNYSSGAGSALGVAGLNAAIIKFRRQTDPGGKPLGVQPRTLLVPPDLEATALELLRAITVNNGASAQNPDVNIYSGRFQPVVSSYLTSAAQWYLFADPSDLPAIEVVFLNGNQTPIVETADADFNTLGIQMRGYYDYGVALQEYRGAVQSNGS